MQGHWCILGGCKDLGCETDTLPVHLAWCIIVCMVLINSLCVITPALVTIFKNKIN